MDIEPSTFCSLLPEVLLTSFLNPLKAGSHRANTACVQIVYSFSVVSDDNNSRKKVLGINPCRDLLFNFDSVLAAA